MDTEEFDCKPREGGRIGLSIGQYLINGIFTDGKIHTCRVTPLHKRWLIFLRIVVEQNTAER